MLKTVSCKKMFLKIITSVIKSQTGHFNLGLCQTVGLHYFKVFIAPLLLLLLAKMG